MEIQLGRAPGRNCSGVVHQSVSIVICSQSVVQTLHVSRVVPSTRVFPARANRLRGRCLMAVGWAVLPNHNGRGVLPRRTDRHQSRDGALIQAFREPR